MTDKPDESFGNPSAAWLRAWRQVDIFLGSDKKGNQVRKMICNSAMKAMENLKQDTMSQLENDSFSRAHLMCNELIQLQKMIGYSCFGPASTQTQREKMKMILEPISKGVGPIPLGEEESRIGLD